MNRRQIQAAGVVAAVLAVTGAHGADPTNAPARTDYASFRVVVERNIFNASRSGRSQSRDRESRRPSRVDTFGLVGTMVYEKGPVAFFDGSSSEYRKDLKPGGVIAGYQLEAIRLGGVTLRQASNSFELHLGDQMRREDDGEWKPGGQFEAASSGPAESPGSPPGGPSGSRDSGRSGRSWGGGGGSNGGSRGSSGSEGTASSGGDMSEVLKRLMEKREKE